MPYRKLEAIKNRRNHALVNDYARIYVSTKIWTMATENPTQYSKRTLATGPTITEKTHTHTHLCAHSTHSAVY